jgi:hypothetical protein
MKKIVLILSFALFSVAAGAQNLWVAPVFEKTVAGNQYGALLMFKTKKQLGIGAFYQTTVMRTADGLQKTDPFYGMKLNVPLVSAKKIVFYANIRCGIVNQVLWVVAPALETEIKLTQSISFSAMMGIRMAYPSSALSISVKL